MELGKSNSTITDVLEAFGNEMIDGLKGNLEKSKALASGDLYQSINFSAKVMGSQFHFVLDMGVDYWKAVDEGRRPSQGGSKPGVLKGAILKWVNEKATFGGFSNVPNIKDKAVQRGLAYVIARKIHKKGTKGNQFYSKTVTPQRIEQLKKDLGAAAGKDLQSIMGELTEKTFKEFK